MNEIINETYGTYILISVALTIWVARTLYKNGKVFLVDVFSGDEDLAQSINHLLVVGFYLVNFGFVCLNLKTDDKVISMQAGIELLATKEGIVLLVLGAMHFTNLIILSAYRSNHLARQEKQQWLSRNIPPRVNA